MFSLATLVYINEYKAQSNCNQDPTFRHSSLVSSSGVHINMSNHALNRNYGAWHINMSNHALNRNDGAWHINMRNHALNRDDGAYLSEEYVHLIGR
jgi:hypothetical protein